MRTLSLLLLFTTCTTPAPGNVALTDTVWAVVELNGEPASGPTIQFLSEGARISANGGCNSISGTYELNDSRLRAGEALTMTRRACVERERNVIENEFVRALEAMRSHAISGRTLTLYEADGREVAKLEARQ